MTKKGTITVISTIAAIITVLVFITGKNLPDWFTGKGKKIITEQTGQGEQLDIVSLDDNTIDEEHPEVDEANENEQLPDSTEPPTPSDTEPPMSAIDLTTADNLSSTTDGAIEILPYNECEYHAESADIQYYSGAISDNNQEDTYVLVAPESGSYRFELSNMISGFRVSMYLYDENGDRIDYNSNISNGSGLTASLNAGKTYTLSVTSYTGEGTYDLIIGEQKSIVDISPYTTVYDEIEFTGQEICYYYTPSTSGIYRFEIAQINYGIKVSLYIYDASGYRVDSNVNIGQDNGVTVTLEEGKTYSVLITQYTSVGEFSMNIGPQQPSVDISSCSTLIDSTQYLGQTNNYYFTAAVSGTYRFEIGQINNDVKVSMYVFDMAGYQLEYYTAMGRGNGVTVTLEVGQTYLIQIIQYKNYGTYTMSIGSQKETVDISGLEHFEDCIQYTDQVNNYIFTPQQSGTYYFLIDNLSSDARVSVYVYDNAGYRLAYSTWISTGDKVKAELEAYETYNIQVSYNSGYSSYTLNVNY